MTQKLHILLNGEPRSIAPGTTIAVLLEELGRNVRHVAVEVNLELAPREQFAEFVLSENDRLEIVTLVGGG